MPRRPKPRAAPGGFGAPGNGDVLIPNARTQTLYNTLMDATAAQRQHLASMQARSSSFGSGGMAARRLGLDGFHQNQAGNTHLLSAMSPSAISTVPSTAATSIQADSSYADSVVSPMDATGIVGVGENDGENGGEDAQVQPHVADAATDEPPKKERGRRKNKLGSYQRAKAHMMRVLGVCGDCKLSRNGCKPEHHNLTRFEEAYRLHTLTRDLQPVIQKITDPHTSGQPAMAQPPPLGSAQQASTGGGPVRAEPRSFNFNTPPGITLQPPTRAPTVVKAGIKDVFGINSIGTSFDAASSDINVDWLDVVRDANLGVPHPSPSNAFSPMYATASPLTAAPMPLTMPLTPPGFDATQFGSSSPVEAVPSLPPAEFAILGRWQEQGRDILDGREHWQCQFSYRVPRRSASSASSSTGTDSTLCHEQCGTETELMQHWATGHATVFDTSQNCGLLFRCRDCGDFPGADGCSCSKIEQQQRQQPGPSRSLLSPMAAAQAAARQRLLYAYVLNPPPDPLFANDSAAGILAPPPAVGQFQQQQQSVGMGASHQGTMQQAQRWQEQPPRQLAGPQAPPSQPLSPVDLPPMTPDQLRSVRDFVRRSLVIDGGAGLAFGHYSGASASASQDVLVNAPRQQHLQLLQQPQQRQQHQRPGLFSNTGNGGGNMTSATGLIGGRRYNNHVSTPGYGTGAGPGPAPTAGGGFELNTDVAWLDQGINGWGNQGFSQ